MLMTSRSNGWQLPTLQYISQPQGAVTGHTAVRECEMLMLVQPLGIKDCRRDQSKRFCTEDGRLLDGQVQVGRPMLNTGRHHRRTTVEEHKGARVFF